MSKLPFERLKSVDSGEQLIPVGQQRMIERFAFAELFDQQPHSSLNLTNHTRMDLFGPGHPGQKMNIPQRGVGQNHMQSGMRGKDRCCLDKQPIDGDVLGKSRTGRLIWPVKNLQTLYRARFLGHKFVL